MKKNQFKILTALMVIASIFSGCSKDEDENLNNDNNPPPANVNKYMGSASYGDIITFQIDEDNNTYSYINETTGNSDNGTYTSCTESGLTAFNKISIGSDDFYALELREKFYATSLPSGRTENKLSFCVNSDLDLASDYSTNELAGKYLFIMYDDNNNTNELYGGYELKENGTYTWQWGPYDVDNFDENSHFSGGGSGTWAVSSENSSRIEFIETSTSNTFYGTILPNAVILVDLGTGNGFHLGLKYPATHYTQSEISGRYYYFDLESDGDQAIGYYDLPSSGTTVTNYNKPINGTVQSLSSSDYYPINSVNNMFLSTFEIGSETYYGMFIVLPENMMLHFVSNNDNIVNYGIAIRK